MQFMHKASIYSAWTACQVLFDTTPGQIHAVPSVIHSEVPGNMLSNIKQHIHLFLSQRVQKRTFIQRYLIALVLEGKHTFDQ